jgi:hypothetical protein
MLDFFKCRIENTWDKSIFRRKIEILIKIKKVDEIPNMVNLMET